MNKNLKNLLLLLIVTYPISSPASLFQTLTNVTRNISNAIMPTSPHQREIAEMLEQQDSMLKEASEFWNNFQDIVIQVLDDPTFDPSPYLESFEQATEIGMRLADYHLIDVFETQYNALFAAVDNRLETLSNPIGQYYEPSDMTITDAQIFEDFSKIRNSTALLLEIINTEKYTKNRSLAITHGHKIAKTSYTKIPDLADYSLRFRSTDNFNQDGYNFTSGILGDGNCGYRSFLSSVYVNAITSQNYQAIQRLQELIERDFSNIFTIYGSQSRSQVNFNINSFQTHVNYLDLSEQDIEDIKMYLLNQLEDIKSCQNIAALQNILNREYGFDFYTIMFLRGLIAQYMIQHDESLFIAAIARDLDNIAYLDDLLRWKQWIDQPELTALNNITGIAIYVINNSARENRLTSYDEAMPTFGRADIVFVHNNHYNILHQINR